MKTLPNVIQLKKRNNKYVILERRGKEAEKILGMERCRGGAALPSIFDTSGDLVRSEFVIRFCSRLGYCLGSVNGSLAPSFLF